MMSRAPIRAGEFLLLTGLLALCALAYLPVLGHDFLLVDDGLYVTDEPMTQRGLTWEGVRWALTTHAASNWHPLNWLSHMLDVSLFGLDPGGHHLTNLLLHLANVALLYFLLRHMMGLAQGGPPLSGPTLSGSAQLGSAQLGSALFGSALFALHPTHVESVAWIAERKDVLSLCFGLMSLHAYLFYARSPSIGRYLLVAILLAAALMSKPMMVTLPCVMLLLDVWPGERWQWIGRATEWRGPEWRSAIRLVAEKIPLLALSAVSCVMTLSAQTKATVPESLLAPSARLGNAIVSYTRYLGMLAWPIDLLPYYIHPGHHAGWVIAGCATLLVALTGLAIWQLARRPWLLVGWLWFLGTLIPVIGLVQVGGQAIACRYTYFPFIGLYLIVAMAIAECSHVRPKVIARSVVAAGVLVVLLLGGLTRHWVGYWRDTETLYRYTVERDPDNLFAHRTLGESLQRQGRYDEAMASFRVLARAMGEPFSVHVAMASKYPSEPAVAAMHLREAARLRPDNAPVRRLLAQALARAGRLEDSLDELRRLLEDDPDDVATLVDFAGVMLINDEPAAALPLLERAQLIDPEHVTRALNHARALLRLGRLEDASDQLAILQRVAPDHPAIVQLARELATP